MGISPGIPPGEAGEPEWWPWSMRRGGSWKGLPDVVGAWLPEYPCFSFARLGLENGARC